MFEEIQKKMTNVNLFIALIQMDKKIGTDLKAEKEKQNKHIAQLMKKAYEIPFYRKRFNQAGVKPEDIRTSEDLAKLPPLTKDELRVWMKEEADKPEHKNWFADTTSGSSGTPLTVVMSPKEKAWMMANWFRVLMKSGYNPVFGKMMTRINAHEANHKTYDTFLQRLGFMRRRYVNQFAPEEEVIAAINEYQPDLLYLNNAELMRIALYSRNHDMKIWKPRFYAPIGEKTDDVARALFTQVFGDGLIDSYGSAETGACLLKVPGSNEYIVHNDYFVVNIYDEQNCLADEGKVVITPLFKTDMPIINYVIGDSAESRVEEGIRFVTNIKGRMNDVFKYADGSITTFFEVMPIITHNEDVIQIRFIQEGYDFVRVQAVQDNEKSIKSKEEIEQELTEQFLRIMKHEVRFVYEWMSVIPPDPNGKLRMIVCNIK